MLTEEDIALECEAENRQLNIFSVSSSDSSKRLDVFVSEQASLSRSAEARLIDDGKVTVNGKNAAKNCKLAAGESVEIEIPEAEPCEALAENIPLDVIYEDDDIIVICKPQGMVVHPAAGNSTGTLVNALLYHCGDSVSGIGGVVRPGIVHIRWR